MTKTPKGQRDYMRGLVAKLGRNKDAVCAAYATAELDGSVVRSRIDHSISSAAYAEALWRDGDRKGWLDE